MRVLAELGIHAGEDRRIVEVWNKIDRVDAAQREALRSKGAAAEPPAVLVSATTGEGLPELLAAIERKLTTGRPTVTVELRAEQLGAAPWLYDNTEVLQRRDDPETGRAQFRLRIAESRMHAFQDWARRQHATVAASEADAG
jgi:GTP-binding protein HflX